MKHRILILNIVVISYLLTLTVGYAFFNKALTVKGVASTVDYYDGQMLPTTPIILNNDSNFYHSSS